MIEILIAIFILSAIIGLLGAFQSDVFSLNRVIQTGLKNQEDAKKIIRPFVQELRSAEQSNLGSYPISEASTSTISFYSDIDSDGLKERIRYFRDGNSLKKGIIKPSGEPIVYDADDERIINLINDVLDEPLFEYYDNTGTSTPLSFPITPSDIRLVKVTVKIDSDPIQPPEEFIVTTVVSIRNMKDNL